MNKLLLPAIVMAMLGGSASAADEPMAIIDKAIKAHGGFENRAKAAGESWTVDGVMNFTDMKIPYKATYTFARPMNFLMDMSAEFGGQKVEMKAATDGKKAWESMGADVRDMAAKKAESFEHNVYGMSLTLLVPLKEKEFTLSAVPETKVNDKPAAGIKVASKGHADVTLYFDKESGLVVKSVTEIYDEFTDKTVPQEVFFEDYKDKNGVKVLGKLRFFRSGKELLAETITENKVLEKIDPKIFAKPGS